MRRTFDGLYTVSLWAAAACLATIFVLVTGQVTLNLVDSLAALLTGQAIGLTIPSYSDFTGVLLAAASFLALAGTLREGGHIRVTLLIGRLPPRLHRLFDLWGVALALGLCAFFTWHAGQLTLESQHYGDKTPGIVAIPIWIPQLAMTAGLAMLCIALIDDLVTLARGQNASFAGKGENLLGDEDV